MISSSCSIREFADALQGKDYLEIIYIAEQEATEAERSLYRPKTAKSFRQNGGEKYANLLKDFIFYIRYGVKTPAISDSDFQMFRSLRKGILKSRAKHCGHNPSRE